MMCVEGCVREYAKGHYRGGGLIYMGRAKGGHLKMRRRLALVPLASPYDQWSQKAVGLKQQQQQQS